MNSKPAPADRERASTLFGNAWAHIRTSQFWMVAIALFLRVGWIIAGHTYKFKSADNNFGFGWEMGRIAAAIASGHGFSNPFGVPTGPTAWEPPLYPYLIAGVFQIFGIYSRGSAFVLLTINSIFSSLTSIPIFLIARRIFSEKVAVGSAWTWILLPYVMFWCTRWVWETSLSALLIAVILWLALTLEDRDGVTPWVCFGLLWGIAALNSTALLAFLPVLARVTQVKPLAVFDSFYRAGSLVFGGGHVVLPLLRSEVVRPGWIGDDAFLAGYGAAQALPGPLFTFAAYLGTVIQGGSHAWTGGLLALFAIFLPGWLLVGGAYPFWHLIRGMAWARAALRGADAAVVGLLLAALYRPVCTEGIRDARDVAAALAAAFLLGKLRTPPWAVVLLMAALGQWALR